MKTDLFYKGHSVDGLPLNLVDDLLKQCHQSPLTNDEKRALSHDMLEPHIDPVAFQQMREAFGAPMETVPPFVVLDKNWGDDAQDEGFD